MNELEIKIEENHDKLNKKLENVERKFDANISSIVQSDNYQTLQLEKLVVDLNCPTDNNFYRKLNGGSYYIINQKKTYNNA